MDKIFEAITDAIHDFLTDVVGGIFISIFDDVNASVGTIAGEAGKTPSDWDSSIFNMIKSLSDNVIIPIAAVIISYVLCYELITTITEKNNMRDVDTFIFYKYVFKACVAVYLLSHTFDITMAIFDVGQWVVSQSSSVITQETSVDVTSIYLRFSNEIFNMDNGELFLLMLEALVVSLLVKAISILITVVLVNRMIEIYIYCSVAPIPFATLTNREWGGMGTNYVKGLLSLAFQAFFIMVIVGIYAVLVQELVYSESLHSALLRMGAYTIILCIWVKPYTMV